MWADQVSIGYIFATKWTIHDSASLYFNSSIVVGVYKGFWNVKKIEEEWNFIYVLKKNKIFIRIVKIEPILISKGNYNEKIEKNR